MRALYFGHVLRGEVSRALGPFGSQGLGIPRGTPCAVLARLAGQRQHLRQAHPSAPQRWVWLTGMALAVLQGHIPDAFSLAGCHYVAMDFSGHGLSSHRPAGSPYHFLDYVSDVRRVAAGVLLKGPLRDVSAGGALSFLLLGRSRQHLLLGEGSVPFASPHSDVGWCSDNAN